MANKISPQDMITYANFVTHPSVECDVNDKNVIDKATALGVIHRLTNNKIPTTIIFSKGTGNAGYAFVYFNPKFYIKADAGFICYKITNATNELIESLFIILTKIHNVKIEKLEIFDTFNCN